MDKSVLKLAAIFAGFSRRLAIRTKLPGQHVERQSSISSHIVILLLASMAVCFLTPIQSVSASEGMRLPARASAQISAPGYGPELAVDMNEASLWIASLTPQESNNRVWFQLDLGAVKQVARLHWLAAAGTPYPASAPKKYQVAVSNDGSTWNTVFNATAEGANEGIGNVQLNTNARYVRLITTQVNDGTGWALGLREIWITEGRDISSSASIQLRIRATMNNGRINLTWQLPKAAGTKFLRLYRSTSPADAQGRLVAKIGAGDREYNDMVPNWTPYYYWVQALDSSNRVVGASSKVAAFAHPADALSERTETFSFWYEGYKPSSNPDASVRHIGKADFVAGFANASMTDDLSKSGLKMIQYITLYQTWDWISIPKDADTATTAEKIAPIAFYRKTVRFPGSPAGYVPSIFCRPGSPEYNPRTIQYTTCPNSATFRNVVLNRVRSQLANGVFGFFVDNGYQDDIAASSICQSTAHSHYYGKNLTSADAFLGMLMEITCAVKKHNPRGMVMVNGGVPANTEFYGLKLGDVSSGQLWEGYLRSSYSTLKEHVYDWETVYRRSVDLEKAWHSTPPRRMFVLSYPWDRDEAYFCYATAKLCDLPWSAGLGISDPDHKQFGGHFGTYPELVNLRLGSPTDVRQYGGEKLGEVYARRFQRGVVVVNPTKQAQEITLSLTGRKQYRDIFAKKDLSGEMIVVALPPESGRVYLYK